MVALFLFPLAFVLIFLAIYVWHAQPGRPVNRYFTAYTLVLAGWVVGVASLHARLSVDLASRLAFASASLIPATFLAFTHVFPSPGRWPNRTVLRSVMFLGVLFALLALVTPFIAHSVTLSPSGLTRKTGPLYFAFAVYFLAAWLTGIVVFIEKWRHARGQPRAHLQYLGIGLLVSGLGGITTNLLIPLITHRSDYSWLGPYFILPLVLLVGHAIIRHRLMDLRFAIHRSLSYAGLLAMAATLAVSLPRAIVPAWSSQPFPAASDLWTITVLALLTFTWPAQRVLAKIVDPYLYRGRLDHDVLLREATRKLTRLMQPVELAEELHHILSEAFVPEAFAMLALPSRSGPVEELSSGAAPFRDALCSSELVLRFLHSHSEPSVFLLDRPGVALSDSEEHLRATGVELIMILGRRSQFLGAVLLGSRRSGDAYYKRDLSFTEALAEIASVALENALLYRQRIQILEYSERLLESLDSAVVAVDPRGDITSLNPAATRLLGISTDSRGLSLDALPSEVGWALALALRIEWQTREHEVLIDHSSRGPLAAILSNAILHDDAGLIAGALVVVTDVSTLKALERNQRRVEHLEMMTRFYAGLAHEIRSPLTAISNFVSMLPDRFDDKEYRDTAIRLLPHEVSRIVRLADRLRMMAPGEGGSLTVIDVEALLTDLVTIHSPRARDHGIQLRLSSTPHLPQAMGDRAQLTQLFVNLLNNALEAMPQGGCVLIDAYGSHNASREPTLIVRVVDEGVGIEPSLLRRVFQPFVTTKTSGTGLGLSICREIADFHRAHLRLLPRQGHSGMIAEVEFTALAWHSPQLLAVVGVRRESERDI